MVNLPPNTDHTNPWQKGFAFGLMGAAAFGAIKLFNWLAPTLLLFMKNLWLTVILGTPLVLLALYIITNPLVVWGLFKTLSWNLTKFFIKMDPLSVMERYVDYLRKKLSNLNATKVELMSKKEKLERKLQSLEESAQHNLKVGSAARDKNIESTASTSGIKAAADRQSIALFKPIYERICKNVDFLQELSENWETSIEKLSYTIERKREEHEALKEMAKSLQQAEDYITQTEAGKLYQESLKQLEIQVTRNIASIEEFEKRSKNVRDKAKVETQMAKDEGLTLIDEYRKSGALKLPDFTMILTDASKVQDISFEPVRKFDLSK